MFRFVGMVALLLAFLLTGIGVYYALDRSKAHPVAGHAATTGTRAHVLPGTLFVAQQGRLYSLRGGLFKQLTPPEGWTQPALSPDGTRLVAVKRAFNYSDLYLLSLDGRVEGQLTHNSSGTVEFNHWAFFPRFSPDGQSIFYSYDPKDPYNSFRVDLAVYSLTVDAPTRTRAWSAPNHYTGGDVQPAPLRSGGLVYSKYSIDEQGVVHSQVWIQARVLSAGAGLTEAADDCGQAAVSRDESQVAMVCRHAGDATTLEIAPLELATFALGPRRVLVANQQVSSPAFSPDAASVAYYAPAKVGGPLQLWTVAAAPAAAPASPRASPSAAPPAAPAPIQVTSGLAFDATSPAAWG